jgi:hypothetical protein
MVRTSSSPLLSFSGEVKAMNDEEKTLGWAVAIVAVHFLNAAIIAASPRVSAKIAGAYLREHLIEQTAAVLAAIEEMRPIRGGPDQDDALIRMEPEARTLKALLDGWAPDRDMPDGVVEAARASLRAYGAPVPPEGWDQFDG